MNNDRRTRRTRQILRDAFLSLLKEKRYEDISVQDIIERADVARSTFYAHYIDKEDLLVGQRGVFASDVQRHADVPQAEKKSQLTPPICFWHNIRAQRDIFKIIARDSAMDVTMKDLHHKLSATIQVEIQQQRLEQGPVPASLIVDYLADSIITLIKWWVKQGMMYSPEQMDEMFRQMTMPVIGSKASSYS
jgi:AcrR family transcriptional regulator